MKLRSPHPLHTLAVWLALYALYAPAGGAQEADRRGADRAFSDSPAEVASTVPDLMRSGEVTGLSVAVIRDGELAWSGAFGVQDAESEVQVTRGTVFQAASLSKPVFAYAVLRLVDRGLLDLDTPLADYLPYERLAHDPRYTRITARMALSHSTGLPNWGGDRLELGFDPGSGFNYSGEGYVYLQKTVEKLTGKTLNELVAAEVFEPLGMTSSSYVWRPEFAGRAAAGHGPHGEPLDLRRPEEGNAAHSLLTTAEDYARFLIAVLEGRGLSPETLEQAFGRQVQMTDRPGVEAEGRLYWGLGFGLQFGRAGRALWHWGHNDGFKDYFVAYPEERSGLVYFSNSANGLSIAEDLLAAFVDDDQWALTWLGYERHDDPKRLVRRRLERTFLRDGTEAGLQLHARLVRAQPEVADEGLTNGLGYFLLRRGANDAAIALFERNAESYPGSLNVWDSLGEGYMNVGEYGRALESYERSVEPDPDNENGKEKIAWLREAVAALADPVEVPEGTLRRYAGDYGPRHVRLAEDGLHYRRDGNPEYRLIPLSHDTFLLDGLGSFRIRFVVGPDGRAEKIVGLYVNGSRDETPRDG